MTGFGASGAGNWSAEKGIRTEDREGNEVNRGQGTGGCMGREFGTGREMGFEQEIAERTEAELTQLPQFFSSFLKVLSKIRLSWADAPFFCRLVTRPKTRQEKT